MDNLRLNEKIQFFPTRCAICRTDGCASELYPQSLSFESFSPEVFSARRIPDRIHYRLVRCKLCGLVRSDPIADINIVNTLYQKSCFDYSKEIANIRSTYGRYLGFCEKYQTQKESLLEIGCGNGFFLEEALALGYGKVAGVEPSQDAVSKADPQIKDSIVCGVMKEGLFPQQSFDTVCMFQLLDHMADPQNLLKEVGCLLKPNGCLLCLTHNVNSLSSKILREASPIVDIEHTYLFSPKTLRKLFLNTGFEIKEWGAVSNKYSFRYLAHLMPLPRELKHLCLHSPRMQFLNRLSAKFFLGNMYFIVQKS